MSEDISKLAVIDPAAKLAPGVKVGPFTIIGPGVEIGAGTVIGPHAVVMGPTKIGQNNQIYQFASIGEACQDLKYHGEDTHLEIGNNNIFREGCTIHRGTLQGGGRTKIGDNNLFMVNTHVAHDCVIGNHVVFSNNAAIAGHVYVGDYASLGGFVGVHQFCTIGAHSFCGGGSMIMKDVAPFVRVFGNPAQVHGLNAVGLSRRDFSVELMSALKQAYKIVFRTSLTVKDAVEKLNTLIVNFPELIIMRDFLESSERGITR